MGLPSPVNFRVAQVDPTSLIATPSRTASRSEGPSAFERHLDRTASPGSRAAQRREDQRERSRATDGNDGTTPETGQTASDATTAGGGDEIGLASDEQPLADMAPADAATEDSTSAATAAPDRTETENAAPDATAAPADAVAAAPSETPPVEEPVVEAPAEDTATAPDSDEDGKKARNEGDDTDPAALAAALPAPRQPDAGKMEATSATGTAPSATPPAAAPDEAVPAGTQSAADEVQPEEQADGNANADADLVVKPKVEGLGHRTAAEMADKTSERAAAPAQAAQTSNTQAVAAATTAASFAKAANAAGGNGVQSIPATAAGESAATQVTDLPSAGTAQQGNGNSATIRIGTLPGQTTPTVVPAMAIALQIARNVQKGINRFDIRLDPPELGRIDVRMEVQKDGQVSAHLTVEHASTLDLLQRDSRALQQALNDAGLQADSDSLSFSLQDQNAGERSAQDSSGGLPGTVAPDTGATEEIVRGPVYNLNLSASGGVDIRV